MSIHIAPIVLQLRGFKGKVDVSKYLYEMKEPYEWSAIIIINDDGVGRLMGLDGTITHSDRRVLAVKLKGYGIRRVEWKHKGRSHHIDLVNIK